MDDKFRHRSMNRLQLLIEAVLNRVSKNPPQKGSIFCGGWDFGGCPHRILPPGAGTAPSPRGLPPAPGGWGAEAAPGGSPRGLGGWGQPPGARGLVADNGGWGLPCSLNATLEDGTCHTSDSVEWKSEKKNTDAHSAQPPSQWRLVFTS